jgi:hypothetical protein
VLAGAPLEALDTEWVAGLIERLERHSGDDRNTAFARSTMGELLDALKGKVLTPRANGKHIGEDAANGAMGEREAFEAWAKSKGLKFTCHSAHDYYSPHEVQCYYEVWQARAALTAEKVAAEPVREPYQYAQPGSPEFDGAEAYQAHLEAQSAEQIEPVAFVFPPMPPAVVMHDKVGPLFDRLSMQFYASKCMSLAAPQPAQTHVALTDTDLEKLYWTAMNNAADILRYMDEARALLAAQPVSGADHD